MFNIRTLLGALKLLKCLKKEETCAKQKKVAGNPKTCSKDSTLLEIRKLLKIDLAAHGQIYHIMQCRKRSNDLISD